MMTLEEKLIASVRKYFLEPNPIEDGNRVKAVVQDAMRICAEELGYKDMEAARIALLPPKESTVAFAARIKRENERRR